MRFVRVGVFWRRDAVGLDGDPRGGGGWRWGRGWRLGDVEVHRRWGSGDMVLGKGRAVTEAVGGGRDCA